MKIRSLILVLVACVGFFTACSNEEDVVKNANDSDGDLSAFATFSLQLPASSGKATDNPTGGPDGDGKENGTPDEQKINNIRIFLFNGEYLDQIIDLDGKALTGAAPSYQTGEIKVNAGTRAVYVVVNPQGALASLTKETARTKADFLQETFTVGQTAANFMMTNADAEQTVTTKEGETATVTVRVERAVAKVTYTPTREGNVYDVMSDDEKAATVTFQGYKIVNSLSDAYYFRRVSTSLSDLTPLIGGVEILNQNYVMDPHFVSKVKPFTQLNDAYKADPADYAAMPVTLSTDHILGYHLENAMKQDFQLRGYATAIVFKAKYVPLKDGFTDGADFFRHNGVLYTSLKELVEHFNVNWKDGGYEDEDLVIDLLKIKDRAEGVSVDDYLISITSVEDLKEFSVDYYAGGICYYTFWIRHANDGDDYSMGAMEFALVRNNVYKLTINSVAALGEPAEGGDAPDPVEDKEVKLKVGVSVLPWTVRTNDIDF